MSLPLMSSARPGAAGQGQARLGAARRGMAWQAYRNEEAPTLERRRFCVPTPIQQRKYNQGV